MARAQQILKKQTKVYKNIKPTFETSFQPKNRTFACTTTAVPEKQESSFLLFRNNSELVYSRFECKRSAIKVGQNSCVDWNFDNLDATYLFPFLGKGQNILLTVEFSSFPCQPCGLALFSKVRSIYFVGR